MCFNKFGVEIDCTLVNNHIADFVNAILRTYKVSADETCTQHAPLYMCWHCKAIEDGMTGTIVHKPNCVVPKAFDVKKTVLSDLGL